MNEPPIRQAINGTLDAITARSTAYRNLVVFLSLVLIGVTISLVVSWRLIFLSGYSLVLPAVAFWLYLDARSIRLWADRTRSICEQAKLPISVLVTTIAGMRHLPQTTLGGMLPALETQNEKRDADTDATRFAAIAIPEERRFFALFVLSSLGCLGILSGVLWNSRVALIASWSLWLASIWLSRLRREVLSEVVFLKV